MARQEIKIVTLRKDYKFPKEVYIPLKSGDYIDNIISKKGGTMPGTTTVVVGEAGSGKTTLLIVKITNIIDNPINKDKKCLYVSTEMKPLDNEMVSEELPQLKDLETFYLADYKNPMEALEDVLDMGWDYVLLDSFSDTLDRIKDCDKCKLNSSEAETWLISLLNQHNDGKTGKYTAFDVIQHITKGGTYKGSTKLKHNTTAMMFVKVDKKTNERYLFYDKNRRGDINKKLYMNLVDGELIYDENRYLEDNTEVNVKEEMAEFGKDVAETLIGMLKEKGEEVVVSE
jgi:predicted ATP-dependent serine protease